MSQVLYVILAEDALLAVDCYPVHGQEGKQLANMVFVGARVFAGDQYIVQVDESIRHIT